MASLVSIAEGIKTKKGSIIATVVKASDLKEGEGKTGKYIMQRFTLKDETGEINLTAWNEETNLLQLGSKYEIAPWWQEEYEGKPQIGLGKFGKVKLLEAGQTPQPTPESKPAESPKTEVAITKLPEPIVQVIQNQAIELLQIEENVVEVLKKYRPDEAKNGQKIGMMVKQIHDFLHDSKVSQN